MTLDIFRQTLRDAAGQEVRLVPMDLPSICSAIWIGDTGFDWIGYNQNRGMASPAVVHAVAHLSLMHCGPVERRDGGRFACLDTGDPVWGVLGWIGAFLNEDGEALSGLFTNEQEQAATELAASLLARCGYQAPDSGPLGPRGPQAIRCLG